MGDVMIDLVAISLRYDLGWTERRIASQLQLPQQSINRWLTHNGKLGLTNNVQHLEGDCPGAVNVINDDNYCNRRKKAFMQSRDIRLSFVTGRHDAKRC